MRATFVTGMAHDGTNVRQATVRVADGKAILLTNPGDVPMGSPFDYRWTTLAAARHALQATVREDGRRSPAAVSMFVLRADRFTGKDGRERGRFTDFATFVGYLLNTSDADYRGETYDDRLNDAVLVTNQTEWAD